jgi:release factor glutamine methyltransferase
MMRKIFKRVVSFFLIPATRWYLRKERSYSYDGIRIKIPVTVFHPGLFPSTRFLLSYLRKQSLESKTFLELGCGSGLISVWAAKHQALVTTCDLNLQAVKACEFNAIQNKVHVKVFHSDLFSAIPQMLFDWIVINPPYYSKSVTSEEELAWNCGSEFEYFKKLFSQLSFFIHENSHVIMVLTKGCDISAIQQVASENGFQFQLKEEQNVLFDGRDYIFELKRLNS